MVVNAKKLLLLVTLSMLITMTKASDVVMAFSLDIPPYIFQEQNRGIEIDIISAALAVKGHLLIPKYFPLGRIPWAFRNNSVDAVMGDMGTDLSTFGGAYANPAVIYNNVFITLKKNKLVIKKPKDLDNLTVVSFQGAEKRYPQWLKKVKNEKRFYGVSSQLKQIKLLTSGHYDVVLSDHHIYKYFVNKLEFLENIPSEDIDKHKFTEVNADDYRPVFRDYNIRDDFDFGLRHIKKQGLYQEIYDHYIQ
ncbi:substrate-binding periplasmic protein [Psychromonas hadalis]|uniref:substrate-binding periplasmic protein n=1 Tax=Psychromonas hadalis TaxID=211669 RepID=UPI0003B4B220|nr:ABC transporter substrate-binding protein [Psychromonas hadalis]